MQTGMTLYIYNTLEAIEFYQEAFGLSLGYNEKFPDGTYMHAELQKNGVNVFAVSESPNRVLVSAMHEFAQNAVSPTTSVGLKFDTEDEIKHAYSMLVTEGIIHRPLGSLPWSVCSADVLDKYGVYWYIYIIIESQSHGNFTMRSPLHKYVMSNKFENPSILRRRFIYPLSANKRA